MASISTNFCFAVTECFDPRCRFGQFFFSQNKLSVIKTWKVKTVFPFLSRFQVHKGIQIDSRFYVPIVGNKKGNYSREESIQGRII